MTSLRGILLILLLGTCPLLGDEWQFEELFVEYDLEIDNSHGIHGVAVDGSGNIWHSVFGYPTDMIPDENGDSLEIFQIFIQTSDGADLEFSPISVLFLGDSTYPLVAGCRGITTTPDGSILYAMNSSLYKINSSTGALLAAFEYPEGGSIGKPAVDETGRVYVGRVTSNYPVYMLTSDLEIIGTTIDSRPNISRGAAVSPDGKDLYCGTVWVGDGISHYHSDLPGIFPHELVGNIGGWFIQDDSTNIQELWAEDVALGPDGYLYAANTQIEFSNDVEHGSRWYIYDPVTGAELGEFGVPLGEPQAGGTFNGRGIDWSPDGRTMYVGDFGYNSIGIWSWISEADSIFVLKVDSVSIFPGDTIGLPIHIETPLEEALSSLDMQFTAITDDYEITGVDLTAGALSENGWQIESNIIDSTLYISAAGAEEISGNEIIFELEFTVAGDANPQFIPIVPTIVYINEAAPVTFSSGGINILGEGFLSVGLPQLTIPAGSSFLLPIQAFLTQGFRLTSIEVSIGGFNEDILFHGLRSGSGLLYDNNWLIEANQSEDRVYIASAGSQLIYESGDLFYLECSISLQAELGHQDVSIRSLRINDGASNVDASGGGINIIEAIGDRLLHVSRISGNDSTGTGSSEQPYATIQFAVNQAVAGDTVMVDVGAYHENIVMPGVDMVLGSRVIQDPDYGYEALTFIIGATIGSGIRYESGETETSQLIGFTFSSSQANHGGAIACINSSPTISKCNIISNTTQTNLESGSSGGGIYLHNSSSKLQHLQIFDNTGNATYSEEGGGGGIAITNGSSIEMDSCAISWNVASPYGGGIVVIDSYLRLNQCTVVFNSLHSGGSQLWVDGISHVEIQNSILDGEWSIIETASSSQANIDISFSCIPGGLDAITQNGTTVISWDNSNIVDPPLFCQPMSWEHTLAENSPCAWMSTTGSYIGAFPVGCGPVAILGDGPMRPIAYSLEQNFPNPFNPSTSIEFALPQVSLVKLVILDVLGREIKTLRHETLQPARYTDIWDGRNESGDMLPAGIYFARIQAGKYTSTVKMLLLK